MKKTSTTATAALLASVLLLTACDDGSSSESSQESSNIPESSDEVNPIPESTSTESPENEDREQFGEEPRNEFEVDPSEVEEDKVIRDSEHYEYLETPPIIEPGAKYFSISEDGEMGMCSLGWMVQQEGDESRTYNLTAGHCGNPGDIVALDTVGNEDPADMVEIGQFIWQDFDETAEESLDDYALIEFAPQYVDPEIMTGTPDYRLHGEDKDLNLAGFLDTSDLADEYLELLSFGRLGFRNGLSIGPYKERPVDNAVTFGGIADHGDSGGAVWAFDPEDPTTIYAVGVTSYIDFDDSSIATGATIDKVMEELDLVIVS